MNWTKLGYSAGAAVLSGVIFFLVLGFVPRALLVASVAAGGLVGWVVWTRVAMWEIQRAADAAKSLGSKLP